MKIAIFAILGIGWTAMAWAGGDRITLKDGKVYFGDILFTSGTEYVISTSSGAERLEVADIAKIEFGAKAATS